MADKNSSFTGNIKKKNPLDFGNMGLTYDEDGTVIEMEMPDGSLLPRLFTEYIDTIKWRKKNQFGRVEDDEKDKIAKEKAERLAEQERIRNPPKGPSIH